MDGVPDEGNAFAEYGTFCHSLLEKWARGEVLSFELADAYQEGFDAAIPHAFPPYPIGMSQRYYDAGLDYFTSFDGFGAQFQVVAIEEKFHIETMGFSFRGVVDLVLQDKLTGDLIVLDHKSKSKKVMLKDPNSYHRQLYLYASAVQAWFGKAPSLLRFNLFREGVMIDEPYDPNRHEQVLSWVADTIHTIHQETRWPAKPSTYFCRHICSCKTQCPALQ